MGAADDVCSRVDDAWSAFHDAILQAEIEEPTSAGWTAKEMLAHIAFWMETVPPFVTGAFRGDESAFSMTFPSGYVAGEGDWPEADVHNAREAAWAREHSAAAVKARAHKAYNELRAFLQTVTDDEVAAQADYYTDIAGHIDHHRMTELAS